MPKAKPKDFIYSMRPFLKEETSIISCPQCKGAGSYTRNECTDYHKGEYADFRYKCNACDGEGRLVEIKTEFCISLKTNPDVKTVPLSKFDGPIFTTTYDHYNASFEFDQTTTHMEKIYEKDTRRY